ncbi:hypothetical protein BDK51DRAFT_27484 [Blyttiomyces helicus]|uniref:Uncharacterized protein n=1 Tax=Blyttiomyces helicus TaxID=388810 RepID=A0A4P9W7E7_9FUNG|nr:hypothetical protein BDK51DRAFT_27484 [Blyttiomyces helicus]|eukprot:RKO88381.1 hypothetical protein BDK51DRAFT_27484 [Blyttiomyces helicus]
MFPDSFKNLNKTKAPDVSSWIKLPKSIRKESFDRLNDGKHRHFLRMASICSKNHMREERRDGTGELEGHMSVRHASGEARRHLARHLHDALLVAGFEPGPLRERRVERGVGPVVPHEAASDAERRGVGREADLVLRHGGLHGARRDVLEVQHLNICELLSRGANEGPTQNSHKKEAVGVGLRSSG